MNTFTQLVLTAAPLLLVTTGALASEYAGRMACFLDGIINLGAFCCYAFTILTGNAILGTALSVLACTAITFIFEKGASHFKANIFLTALAMNILFAALCSFISAQCFGTRSVLTAESFTFTQGSVRTITALFCYIFAFAELVFMRFTKQGLILRITGSDAAVLEARGISAARYRSLSWIMAAFSGAFCGCTLALRLSSYVPGMAAGRGWTALAAVFLGKKKPVIIIIAVLVFSAAEYAGSYLPNISLFANIPSSVLLALPYIASLLLIFITPGRKEIQP